MSEGKPKDNRRAWIILAVLVVLLFLYFVWPSAWMYGRRSGVVVSRTHRITGKVQYSGAITDGHGWESEEETQKRRNREFERRRRERLRAAATQIHQLHERGMSADEITAQLNAERSDGSYSSRFSPQEVMEVLSRE